MTSLPPEVPRRLRHLAHVVSAYNACLRLEASIQQAINDNSEDVGKKMIYARILGYLIHYVPTDQGLKTIVDEIASCKDDTACLQLGRMYFDHYIRAFKAKKGRTPTPSSHASRPSFDTIQDMIKDTLVEAPQSHRQAKQLALIRDGYRCVVTGGYDASSVRTIAELKRRVTSDPKGVSALTECAHIFAESTNASIGPGSEKREYAASMWAVMTRFGYEKRPEELNGARIHRLENILTLVPNFHGLFDLLQVWFTATEIENKYKLEAVDSLILRPYPEYVTFTSPDPAKYPLPSPVYLAIHAACAKVAHLSGAAAYIDKYNEDLDDSTTLDPSGKSADLLEHALFKGLQALAQV
ncbi:hypothetical protein JR316_0004177 [Psilocybe cubensis]|uniref:Uncharacterized protein n=2 Tax=Psilocybe cubensis TaxID=181762 RepID=A0ACB8H356_PSICU|nr:hypothetical protein JR316_0004177 [Psilocybe cubensis]KAH9482082.1 hypothetical protein JR316_0004177 [Psilocybe cubensis]